MSSKFDSDVTARVVEVVSRSVKNGTMTIWDITTEDGTKWSTFKADMGQAALELKGQVADLKVTIEKKDDGYTNYYLNNIRPNPASAQTPAGQMAAQAAHAQIEVPVVSFDQYKSGEEEKEKRRNQSIHRQTAAKVAAELSKDEDEFWTNVQHLVHFFGTGNVPSTAVGSVNFHAGDDPAPAETAWVNPITGETGTDQDVPF